MARIGRGQVSGRGGSLPGCPFLRRPLPARFGVLGWDDAVPLAEDEAAFVAAAFDEAAAGWSDEEATELVAAQQALGPPAFAPPWLLRGLAVVDHRWARGSGWFLQRVLRQVYAYLYREDAATEIRRIVQVDIDPGTRVLVGHSLGSVVAYDLLRRGGAAQVTSLVTLGSPLPWATVRRALQEAAPTAPGLDGVVWSNVFDPWDVVTAGKGLTPDAKDYRVDNGRTDPHSLQKYLGREETARLIVAGAVPGRGYDS